VSRSTPLSGSFSGIGSGSFVGAGSPPV